MNMFINFFAWKQKTTIRCKATSSIDKLIIEEIAVGSSFCKSRSLIFRAIRISFCFLSFLTWRVRLIVIICLIIGWDRRWFINMFINFFTWKQKTAIRCKATSSYDKLIIEKIAVGSSFCKRRSLIFRAIRISFCFLSQWWAR